jgi:hypothetical protein
VNEAKSEQRNRTIPAISAGSEIRAIGVFAMKCALIFGSSLSDIVPEDDKDIGLLTVSGVGDCANELAIEVISATRTRAVRMKFVFIVRCFLLVV